MKNRETFIYYLFGANKKPLYYENGIVKEANENWLKPNGQPAHLEFSPENWKDTSIKLTRNLTYFGVIREMSTSMKFHSDAFAILKNELWKQGVETIVYLKLMKLDTLNLPYRYLPWHTTEINFAKFEKQDLFFAIESLEGGTIKTLKSNESTDYKISIDDDFINVLLDGQAFQYSRSYIIMENQPIYALETQMLGCVDSYHEGEPTDITFYTVNPGYLMPNQYDNDLIFTERETTTFKIESQNLKIRNNGAYGANIYIWVMNEQTGLKDEYLVGTVPPGIGEKTIQINGNFIAPNNRHVVFVIRSVHTEGSIAWHDILSGEFIISYNYKFVETFTKAIWLKELGQKLLDKIFGENNCELRSDFLTNNKDIAYTSGDMLRRIEGAEIKISFLKWFKSLRGFGLAVGDNYIKAEPLATFFNAEKVELTLEKVYNLKINPAEDLMFNTIKTGYNKIVYNDTNGKFETNQGQQLSTPITRIIKELDLISEVRADATGIERTRTNYTGKKTTDSDSDNDTFMLNIGSEKFTAPDLSAYYKLNRPAYLSVSGMPNWETAYNLELTPKKRLNAWSGFIAACLDRQENKFIITTDNDRNIDLQINYGSYIHDEKADIPINSLQGKLFQPYYITFQTTVPLNALDLISIDGTGVINFYYNGRLFSGFLMDISIKPTDNSVQTWKLLASPNIDMTKL